MAVTNKVEIFNNIKNDYGKATTYEQQSNAVNVWYLAKYDTAAPQEGDGFDDWHGWNMPEETAYYDLLQVRQAKSSRTCHVTAGRSVFTELPGKGKLCGLQLPHHVVLQADRDNNSHNCGGAGALYGGA